MAKIPSEPLDHDPFRLFIYTYIYIILCKQIWTPSGAAKHQSAAKHLSRVIYMYIINIYKSP